MLGEGGGGVIKEGISWKQMKNFEKHNKRTIFHSFILLIVSAIELHCSVFEYKGEKHR